MVGLFFSLQILLIEVLTIISVIFHFVDKDIRDSVKTFLQGWVVVTSVLLLILVPGTISERSHAKTVYYETLIERAELVIELDNVDETTSDYERYNLYKRVEKLNETITYRKSIERNFWNYGLYYGDYSTIDLIVVDYL